MIGPELIDQPGMAEQDAILAVLAAHNEAAVGPSGRRPIARVVRAADGAIAGGLWGASAHRWLFIQYLALPPAWRGRGVGRSLMAAAEAEAAARGCVGLWLDTFSFQARGFYEKLGYAVFGVIEDYPPGHSRAFLTKRIDGR